MTLKQKIAREFETPALVVDLDVVERNIAKLQALCDAKNIANRPHIKTHKSLLFGKMQLKAGAKGITCQKLGEAEIFAENGFDDIFITYNLMGDEKMARLAKLSSQAKMTVSADNLHTIHELAKASLIAERPINVLVECDTGRKRTGVETPNEALVLISEIKKHPNLHFAGLMVYPPENAINETNAFIKAVGEGVVISSGGTPNLLKLGAIKKQTEHRSGTSIFNDRMMIAAGYASLQDCALSVYSTVVSRASEERGIIDAGSKTLTSDQGGLQGFGYFIDYPQAILKGFAEEHGFLDLSATNTRPSIGEIVRIIPNHVCVTVNVVGKLILVRGNEIIGEESVEARGAIV